MDPRDLADLIEERAAIIEEGDRVSRAVAQDRAAQMHGFRDWADYQTSHRKE